MFSKENTAIVLIDIQGKLATLMHDRENLYKGLGTIVRGMNILNVPVIWMEQVPQSLGPTIEEVAGHLGNRTPIAKNTFSCCDNDQFMDALQRIDRSQILLAGIETHICVYQTAASLISRGYQVRAIEECVSSRTSANKQIGLDAIRKMGGMVTSCEMILFELMKSTDAEGFKEIVKLIK